METQKTRMKQKKSEKEGFAERSPLQYLNGNQFHKSNVTESSNLSSSSYSSSAAASVEAPNGHLRFLLSSNSLASSSSSFSRTRLERKPKTSSRETNNVYVKSTLNVMARSKEKELAKKPFSEKSKKIQQPCLDKRHYSKTSTKPSYKAAQGSKPRCGLGNPLKILKKGSEELEPKLKSSQENGSGEPHIKRLGVCVDNNLDCSERFTPAGKKASLCVLDSMRLDDCKNVRENSGSKSGNANSATAVKTPPVEASVSPEIPCGSHSKPVGLNSAATPVCYGAGHLLSGVTDKRKCRRRGSLRGGFEKVNLFGDDDERNDGNVISNSQDCWIPLLAEASVRWISPCNEGREDKGSDSENRLNQCTMSRGNDSVALDLLPSTPNSISNFSSVSSGEGTNLRRNEIENDSAFSLGSISSGNVIQTPSSDSSSYGCVEGLNVEAHQGNFVQFELDSKLENLDALSMSARSEMLIQDKPSLSFGSGDPDSSSESIILIQLQKNVESVCSWASDSTLDSLAFSRTRISWKDGLVCRIDENDELDCCPCLSDEETDTVGCPVKQLMLYQWSPSGGDKENDQRTNSCVRPHPGTESGENEHNALKMDNDVSPILLEYEPSISARGEEKSSGDRLNAPAESICTNGGDLAASCDSDWAYLQENHSFQVN